MNRLVTASATILCVALLAGSARPAAASTPVTVVAASVDFGPLNPGGISAAQPSGVAAVGIFDCQDIPTYATAVAGFGLVG